MIDLTRANVRLRDAFNVYAWLTLTHAATADITRAAREVDRCSKELNLLADIAPILNARAQRP